MRLRAQTYRQAIGSTGAQQLILYLLMGSILRSGVFVEICLFAALAFWVGVISIWLRRRRFPTKMDLLFIEAGFLPILVIAFFLAYFIWKARGVL